MAHHGEHPLSDLELDAICERLGLGATGKYPDGSMDEHDEGEIQIGVTVKGRRVIVAFGKKVSWVGFTGREAFDFGELLIRRAREAMKTDAAEVAKQINDLEAEKLKQAGNPALRTADDRYTKPGWEGD